MCLRHAAQVGRHEKDLQAHGARAALIGAGGLGTPLIRAMKLPVPVLVDADRAVYRAYGLEKRFLIQQSATVIIDRDGVVRYARAAFNPSASFDLPETLAVIETLDRASS